MLTGGQTRLRGSSTPPMPTAGQMNVLADLGAGPDLWPPSTMDRFP
jgi:hypothetical protein